MWAAQFGHDLCARALLEAKADLEKQTAKGWTALILSCQNGHDLCARALLEAGADRTTAVSGWTAQMFAKHYGHATICEHFDFM